MTDDAKEAIDAKDLATVHGGYGEKRPIDPMTEYLTVNVPNGLATMWFKPWGALFGRPLGF
jgi:hypothetical protein